MEFAQSRGKQNQTGKRNRKAKRKGERELNGLSCSINYDKAKDHETRDHVSSKSGKKNQGFHQGINEGPFLECTWFGGCLLEAGGERSAKET